MTGISVLENKISSAKKYMGILALYGKMTRKRIAADVTLKGAVERYLYLLIQCAIDLAEAFIALKRYRKPSTYAEAFEILEEKGLLSSKLAGKMVAMTGFRNIIAHDYEKIDYGIVHDVLISGINDIKAFVTAVERKL